MKRRWLALVVLAAAHSAAADPAHAPGEVALDLDREVAVRRHWRWPILLAESAAVLGAPSIYYWTLIEEQREDWELGWDWDSWRMKLTSFDALVLDTGKWRANAVRHPLSGALSYQIARANGYGPITSTAADFLSAVVWEYVVEYREKVSVNDLVENTVSGFLVGEPLFQLGRIADRRGVSWERRVLATAASPIHRLHAAAGYASWRPGSEPWTRFELAIGASAAWHGEARRPEVSVGLDLEVVTDRRYGAPGDGSAAIRPGAWNRIVFGARGGELIEPSFTFRTRTTYLGRYDREIDATGHGTDLLIAATAGVDYDSRHLAEEYDRQAVFHLIGPRVARGWWDGADHATLELEAFFDLAMVQAHAFGPVLPFPPEPQHSVLQTRGYYYASGASIGARVHALHGRWSIDLEGLGHAMWSIDGRDRVEMNGGENDPHDVVDQRLLGRAVIGFRPGVAAVRIDAQIEGAWRRGAWRAIDRRTTELDAGLGLTFSL